MQDFEKQKNRLREVFPDNGTIITNHDDGVLDRTHYRFYGTGGEDEVIKRFDVILRTGERYGIPYSLLPVLKSKGGSEMNIIAHELHIAIEGRNLNDLWRAISKEVLLWMKESPSQHDSGKDDVFISNIKVEGKGLEY